MPAIGQQQQFHDFKKISAPKISIAQLFEKKFVIQRPNNLGFTGLTISPSSTAIPAADHYTRNFGFFCKEELAIQKRTGVNFSLRLGTLDYCNFLEGKKNALNTSY